jgi:acyl-CoA synthetase (AMP-forming)/AMP-acid ligase II
LARALLGRFEPGDRVAVWAPNIPEWEVVEFGAAMAGLILVTVNPVDEALFAGIAPSFRLTATRGRASCSFNRG